MRYLFAILLSCLSVLFPCSIIQSQQPALTGQLLFVNYLDDGGSELIMRDMSTGMSNVIFTSHLQMRDPLLSPDGVSILFEQPDGRKIDLYFINMDGSGLQKLTQSDQSGFDASWSPDGSQFVFTSSESQSLSELVIFDLATRNQVRLSTIKPAGMADWSAVNNQIVFSSDYEGDRYLYTINSDGSNLRQITDGTNTGSWPKWSPDGRKIAFRGSLQQGSEVLYVNLDTLDVIRIGRAVSDVGHYSWSGYQAILFSTLQASNITRFGAISLDGQILADVTVAGEFDSIGSINNVFVADVPVDSITIQRRLVQQDSEKAIFRYNLTNGGITPLKSVHIRIYFLPDLFYGANEYALTMRYDSTQSATISGPFPSGSSRPSSNPVVGSASYSYFEINYANMQLNPGGSWQAEVQLHLTSSEVGFDATNDWWYTDIQPTITDTSYLPVYASESLITGQTPTP